MSEQGALYISEHTCCSMLILWRSKATVQTGSLICSVLLVVEVMKKVTWTWPGWISSHKNLVVDQDIKHPNQFSE